MYLQDLDLFEFPPGMKAGEAPSHVPIVMLSGQLDIPKRASSAVDAFVAKGQPPAVLLQELATLACEGTREASLGGLV